MATQETLRGISTTAGEGEELAGVVVAAEAVDSPATPWYIVLRPWLFCLLFLLIAEVGMRLGFDRTVCLRHERLDNFPNAAAQDAFVRQIARDRAFRVVVIGDSVVVGPTLLDKDQTMPRYLEQALQRRLPGREIHVWNMSMVGLRSLDQYCMLLKVLEAKPDLVVIPANYFIIAQDTGEMPLNYPWLARNLPEIPAAIRPELKPRERKEAFEEDLTTLVEKNVRLIGLRQAFNGLVFGVQPRSNAPNPLLMVGFSLGKRIGRLPIVNWRQRNYNWSVWSNVYTLPIRSDNRNAAGYSLIIQELRRRQVPGLLYLTPQNPAFMDLYLRRADYLDRRRVLARRMADPVIPYVDYSDVVPDRYFFDNDHMIAGGNRLLAERIAADLAPRIAAQRERAQASRPPVPRS